MTAPKTIVLLGSQNNPTLSHYETYLRNHDRSVIRAHEGAEIQYSITRSRGTAAMRIKTNKLSLSEEDCSIFVQDPFGMVETDSSSTTPSFSSQEWFSTLWSFCGLHPQVVNPPTIGAWGPSVPAKELKAALPLSSLPVETMSSVPLMHLEPMTNRNSKILFAENLGTHHKKLLRSQAELKRWVKRGASQYGLRTYRADNSEQILQLFVGDEVFTLRNDGMFDTETPTHQMLCHNIQSALTPLKLGFYAIAFHQTDGKTRISNLYRDIPYDWFASNADQVFSSLTRLLENPL